VVAGRITIVRHPRTTIYEIETTSKRAD